MNYYVIRFNDLSNAKQIEIKEHLRKSGVPSAKIEEMCNKAWVEMGIE